MFGEYSWMLNGNMLRGVEVGYFLFQVGPDLETEALARPGVTPLVSTGKPMRGIVWVVKQEALDVGLDSWIELAEHYR